MLVSLYFVRAPTLVSVIAETTSARAGLWKQLVCVAASMRPRECYYSVLCMSIFLSCLLAHSNVPAQTGGSIESIEQMVVCKVTPGCKSRL